MVGVHHCSAIVRNRPDRLAIGVATCALFSHCLGCADGHSWSDLVDLAYLAFAYLEWRGERRRRVAAGDVSPGHGYQWGCNQAGRVERAIGGLPSERSFAECLLFPAHGI